jgi:hypothetical protein
VATVTVETPERDDDAASIERETRALQQGRRFGTRWVNSLGQHDGTRRSIQTNEHVNCECTERLFGDDEDLVSRSINNRRARDADERRDVATR